MNNRVQTRISAPFAASAFVLLGIAFVFSPMGWNIIPALLIAILAATLLIRAKSPRPSMDSAPEIERSIDIDEADLKQMDSCGEPAADLGRRINRAFGPIAAGLIIDLFDFASFGPIGLVLGFPVGGLAGYWMGRSLGLSRKATLWCALAAGLYCTMPATEFIPLATILGAVVRFNESGKRRKANSKQ